MSTNAPWLALACDWHESEMFNDTTPGQKLAFIALLCFTKMRGRAGKVTLRAQVLCRDFGISESALSTMLARAVEHEAITIDGSTVQFTNWRAYQDPSKRQTRGSSSGGVSVKPPPFSKSSSTKHQAPSTPHQAPAPSTSKNGGGVVLEQGARKALDRLKIGPEYWANIPPDTTADKVIRHWLDLKGVKGDRPKLLVARLRDGHALPDKQPQPAVIAKAVKAGEIVKVNGQATGRQAQFNADAVVFASWQLPRADIRSAVLE